MSEIIYISIHALAKRATNPDGDRCGYSGHFNPRPRKEGDSRTPTRKGINYDFNPRPRKEGDLTAGKVPDEINISIHALAKRATTPTNTPQSVDLFQSTPSQRGRLRQQIHRKAWIYFNPRPRKEGDANANFLARNLGISIHALAKRATSFHKGTV